MRTFSPEDLKEILRKHELWLLDNEDGERADLSSANLSSANLSYANLSYADLSSADLSSANLSYANLRSANLSSANLRYADLRYANLRSANLSYANLSYADLSSANLSSANLRYADLRYANLTAIKEDFITRLNPLANESIGLYKAILDGKINGSSYEGECCCFVGTVAKNMGVYYESMDLLKPDSNSLTEKFFMGISRGDTPESNPVSSAIKTWLEEFMTAKGIKIPERTITWN